jgi:hypothetical protein
MGKQDSSKTRVVPVFDQLLDADPTGKSWLDELIGLGSRVDIVATVPKGQTLVANHGPRWGKHEASIPAPHKLLEYLVMNLSPKRVESSKNTGEVWTKRKALADDDAVMINDAVTELRKGKRGRRWFVLEGPSRPDALLEGEQIVLCVEGKRTEASCTTETTWMEIRSQLVRHMDAAMDRFPNKRILGLLIVEGDGSIGVSPSPFWIAQSEAQYASRSIDASLPHRSQGQRRRISDGIVGVTTWQAVCSTFSLGWPPSPDVI